MIVLRSFNRYFLPTLMVISGCVSTDQKSDAVEKPSKKVTREDVRMLAKNSDCAKYSWKNRGVAPVGYMEGMALAYARALCTPKAEWNAAAGAPRTQPESVADVYDALSWYNSNLRAAGLNNDPASPSILRNAYTLLIGLGMRESSGKYCTGRDMSADFSSASSAEAGLFQASYGTVGKHPSLKKLFEVVKNDKNFCDLDVFKQGVSQAYCDKNAKNWGTGDGALWQFATKTCPAFAAAWTAVLLRVHGGTKGEFGPLRRKEVEVKRECSDLLVGVEALVKSDPGVCALL